MQPQQQGAQGDVGAQDEVQHAPVPHLAGRVAHPAHVDGRDGLQIAEEGNADEIIERELQLHRGVGEVPAEQPVLIAEIHPAQRVEAGEVVGARVAAADRGSPRGAEEEVAAAIDGEVALEVQPHVAVGLLVEGLRARGEFQQCRGAGEGASGVVVADAVVANLAGQLRLEAHLIVGGDPGGVQVHARVVERRVVQAEGRVRVNEVRGATGREVSLQVEEGAERIAQAARRAEVALAREEGDILVRVALIEPEAQGLEEAGGPGRTLLLVHVEQHAVGQLEGAVDREVEQQRVIAQAVRRHGEDLSEKPSAAGPGEAEEGAKLDVLPGQRLVVLGVGQRAGGQRLGRLGGHVRGRHGQVQHLGRAQQRGPSLPGLVEQHPQAPLGAGAGLEDAGGEVRAPDDGAPGHELVQVRAAVAVGHEEDAAIRQGHGIRLVALLGGEPLDGAGRAGLHPEEVEVAVGRRIRGVDDAAGTPGDLPLGVLVVRELHGLRVLTPGQGEHVHIPEARLVDANECQGLAVRREGHRGHAEQPMLADAVGGLVSQIDVHRDVRLTFNAGPDGAAADQRIDGLLLGDVRVALHVDDVPSVHLRHVGQAVLGQGEVAPEDGVEGLGARLPIAHHLLRAVGGLGIHQVQPALARLRDDGAVGDELSVRGAVQRGDDARALLQEIQRGRGLLGAQVRLEGAPLHPVLEAGRDPLRLVAGEPLQQLLELQGLRALARGNEPGGLVEHPLGEALAVLILQEGHARLADLVDPQVAVGPRREEVQEGIALHQIRVHHQVPDEHLRLGIQSALGVELGQPLDEPERDGLERISERLLGVRQGADLLNGELVRQLVRADLLEELVVSQVRQ
ncbi:hypothetical protein STIAU_4342 [Stigmatella aurantiaca DW4/3-1]|uniref:Uncharacterized protein n=1 Tax=Stigmatella aurantiaca (strain DW4/3-1) TaxID=378806 RepID=Q08UR6_STIAD|nr:hypothetical protein STIAU_4342 [Stigmatella aurantiaca DW4/3-1]